MAGKPPAWFCRLSRTIPVVAVGDHPEGMPAISRGSSGERATPPDWNIRRLGKTLQLSFHHLAADWKVRAPFINRLKSAKGLLADRACSDLF